MPKKSKQLICGYTTTPPAPTAAGCWAKSMPNGKSWDGCGQRWSSTPISRIGGRLILHQSNGKAIQRNSLGISPAVRWQKRKSEMELFIGIMIGIVIGALIVFYLEH